MAKRFLLVPSTIKQSRRIYQDNKRIVILTSSGFEGFNRKLSFLYRTSYKKISFITFYFEYHLLEKIDQQDCGCRHQGHQVYIGGLHKHQQIQYHCTFYEIKLLVVQTAYVMSETISYSLSITDSFFDIYRISPRFSNDNGSISSKLVTYKV